MYAFKAGELSMVCMLGAVWTTNALHDMYSEHVFFTELCDHGRELLLAAGTNTEVKVMLSRHSMLYMTTDLQLVT